ncbi:MULTISPECIES: SH3 domain-containing protein [Roseomonadaceae]|uniref:SH3 domain-containing protein n=1 Tax=Falsiroseomonas oleicola TaxID=2801474 RepID=A0ABS6HD09_9PROT|nr:SH3 domain-containing protein [Roseomonas oleicola]MBU8546635.1 SH3 domain-containing protein [Roseomonas oleicola]
MASLRAHLRDAQMQGELRDIAVFSLPNPRDHVVCARWVTADGSEGDLIARVLPAPPLRMVAGEAVPTRAAMVVMEDGPGLWRGGAIGYPRQRFCKAAEAEAAGGAPDTAPEAAADAAPVATPMSAPTPVAEPAPQPHTPDSLLEAVTVVSPVRVRAGPSGSSDILWVAERGRSFTVHGHAPGGWVQVGDASEPAGWVHASLLDSD